MADLAEVTVSPENIPNRGDPKQRVGYIYSELDKLVFKQKKYSILKACSNQSREHLFSEAQVHVGTNIVQTHPVREAPNTV